jgi:hypothetical protein
MASSFLKIFNLPQITFKIWAASAQLTNSAATQIQLPE